MSERRTGVVYYPTESEQIKFAVDELESVLRAEGMTVRKRDSCELCEVPDEAVVFASSKSDPAAVRFPDNIDVGPEGFRLKRHIVDGTRVHVVTGGDDSGAMYGVFDLAEQVAMHGIDGVEERDAAPRFSTRAVKFNLPWSPYRSGEHNDTQIDTCRDLEFWRSFLSALAQNRFNVISLWNLHPFPYMVQLKDFPEACPFTDRELQEWRTFWKELFSMADARGFDVYLLNWNILVPPAFAEEHDVNERADTSEIVKEYTRKSVTAVVDEYEGVDGLGFCLGEWMGNPVGPEMTPAEKERWIEETFIEGIANADRNIQLVHRSAVSDSIDELRDTIERAVEEHNLPSPVVVPSKFNWSHGHSTTSLELTHDYQTGEVDSSLWAPTPTNYEVNWMVRNEDFFVLRWGDPDFVREHLRENGDEYVGGYFVGSEGVIPARDYAHTNHKHRTWQYAFERQWLFYTLWGRLLYDPETPDEAFEHAFERRYSLGVGRDLLEAYRRASKTPLRLASFHTATWDYTLYAEGFLAPEPTPFAMERRRSESVSESARDRYDPESSFISVDDLIYHEPLDPSYMSIPEYVDSEEQDDDAVTPLDLAGRLEEDAERVAEIVDLIRSGLDELAVVDGFNLRPRSHGYHGALECELADLEAWSHLGRYFAEKLRAGVHLETFRQAGNTRRKAAAVSHLENATTHWESLSETTTDHYDEIPYREGERFSWEMYLDDVRRDVEIARNGQPQ